MLALDIFYNLLYKEIDAKYPFDDKYMNMNPMSRISVNMDGNRQFVYYGGERRIYKDAVPDGLEWMDDEISPEFAYIWDSNLWSEYFKNSKSISDRRKECTTPRGVLAKVHRMVNELEYKWEYYLSQRDSSDQDYKWFAQKGKVYTHWNADKSMFTKYVNLHLGRAYDVMSGKEYCELMEISPVDGKYVKPKFSDIEDEAQRRRVRDKMMERGFKTLIDAFSVVKNERLLNVCSIEQEKVDVICDFTEDNSVVGCSEDVGGRIVCDIDNMCTCVEDFSPDNMEHYSQSQCAIALERIFSRIYKYLQFKSTTSETFQRRINIDSGYKYLTTDSLKNSDHDLNYYHDGQSEKQYLRYLNKLNFYLNGKEHVTPPDIGLTDDEQAVLSQFCKVLSKQTLDWLGKKWDLCPLIERVG